MTGTCQQAAEMDLGGDIEAHEASRKPARDRALLWGMAVLTVFFAAQILQLFPSLEGFQIAKIAAAAVAILFITSPEQIAGRARIRATPQLKLILGMLALALITIPFSVWPSGSLQFIAEVYLKNVVFVYLLAQTARSPRNARVISGALVAGSAILVIAMLIGFGPQVTYKADPSRTSIGGSYDPNDMALLFIVSIPFAVFMLKDARPRNRALLIAAIALMMIGMVKTGSRGGFVGLIVIAGLILIRSSAQFRRYSVAAIAAGILLFALAAPPTYWERINTIVNYEDDYNIKENVGRLVVWRTGLKMVAAHPLTGVGISGFQTAYRTFSNSKVEISPHNSFLQVAAELGVFGFLLFTAIIFVSIHGARRIRKLARQGKEDAELIWMASAVEVGFIGFVVSAFFLTHAYTAIFCFLAGISAALLARRRTPERENSAAQEIEYA